MNLFFHTYTDFYGEGVGLTLDSANNPILCGIILPIIKVLPISPTLTVDKFNANGTGIIWSKDIMGLTNYSEFHEIDITKQR